MASVREEFLRRYATSPIHIPRLERLLDAYGDIEQDDSFPRRFIAWDRACRDVDAARIVTEIVSSDVLEPAWVVRLSDAALRGAIRWMAEATAHSVADRARILKDALSSRDEAVRRQFIEFLETSEALGSSEFRVAAHSL